jgi:hypothetical protein
MKNNFFVIGIFLIMIVSCADDGTINYLDHSKWFIFEKNDTLIFKSGALTDTYRISDIVNEHEIIDKKEGDEILWVNYEGIPSCQNCPVYTFNRDYLGVYFQGKMPEVSFSYGNTPAINYLLGDTLLKDIYIVADIPTEDTLRHKVKSIYYSDIYGIIRYDMYDDRIYELQLE